MAKQENKSPLIPFNATLNSLEWMQQCSLAKPCSAEAYKAWSPEQGIGYERSVKANLRLAQNLISYLRGALGKMNADGRFNSLLHAFAKAHEGCLKLSEQQSLQHQHSSSPRFNN